MNLLENFHLTVIEYLYRGRRTVPLKIFTGRVLKYAPECFEVLRSATVPFFYDKRTAQ